MGEPCDALERSALRAVGDCVKRSPLRSNPETVKAWLRRSAKALPAPTQERLREWKGRSKGLPRRNPKRAAEAYERNFGSRADWVREQPCLIHERVGHVCNSRTQAAHARPRKAGGRGGNRRDLVPLCAAAHAEAGEFPGIGRWEGTQRWAFEVKYELSLVEKAAEIAALLDSLGYE
jgi:hypothetical protein